jgi:hypothetical protein
MAGVRFRSTHAISSMSELSGGDRVLTCLYRPVAVDPPKMLFKRE